MSLYYLVDLLAVGLGNQHRGGIAARRRGRCWKVAGFGGTKADLKLDNFCGRKPYLKFDVAKWGFAVCPWLVTLSRADAVIDVAGEVAP